MIRNLGKLFMALCLLTVGGGIVANAQIDTDALIQANVPFTFVVGNTTLPAGKYQIKGLDDLMPGVLELSGVNGRTRVVIDTESVQPTGDQMATHKGELVFDKVGDKYFLAQVFVPGSASGAELPKSRMEKKLEGDGSRTERHSIAAVLRHRKP